MKKKVILSSVLTILLCISLIAGSTFALFTSESSVNIAVTAGKVDVKATIEDLGVYSPTKITSDGTITDETNARQDATTFSEGGTATLGEDGTLTLDKIVPGDKATFQIKITNNSNVAIKYRTIIEVVEGSDTGLFNGLEFKIGEETTIGSTRWTDLQTTTSEITLACEVTLPTIAGNDYKNTSCKIRFSVEAVQGNTDTVTYVFDINSLRTAIANGEDVKLMSNIILASEDCYKINDDYGYCMILAKKTVNIDLNGYTISYTRDASKGDVNARFGIVAASGATVNVYDSSENKTGGIVIDDDEEYCLTNHLTSSGYVLYAENGATLNVYGGNYVTSNSVVAYARIGGTINIYGGTYRSSYYPGGEGVLLNIPNGSASTNIINVYGGSYEKFEPGVNNAGEAILADGYKVEQDGDWYNVVPET